MRILGRNLWSMKTIFDKLILYLSDGRRDELRGHSSAHIHFQNAKCDLWMVPFYQHYWCLCSGLVRDRENPHHIVLMPSTMLKNDFGITFLKKVSKISQASFRYLMVHISDVLNVSCQHHSDWTENCDETTLQTSSWVIYCDSRNINPKFTEASSACCLYAQ